MSEPRVRIIARLDIKGPHLIKAINLEGLRVVGDPKVAAERYFGEGIDEIVYVDAVASLYNRNSLTAIVEYTAGNLFVPFTAGGGIRSAEDARSLLLSGADKVLVNTQATKDPGLITEIAERFGSQCMVLSIEAKSVGNGVWEAYVDNGREQTGRNVVAWAKEAVERGAGEILLTSVDREGTRRGFDVELVRAVSECVPVPVVASGGMGSVEHFIEVVKLGGASGVAIAGAFHYSRITLQELRDAAQAAGIRVRLGTD